MITRHPSAELLIAHAAGQLDVAYRVLLEAHLGFCSQCAEELAGLLAPGGQLLEGLPDPPVPGHILERLVDRARGLRRDGGLDPMVPLPSRARAELPVTEAQMVSARVPLSPARYTVLHHEPESETMLVLLWMPGGRRFPHHRHLGEEAAVVLTGGYQDPFGHFVAGDLSLYQEGTEHGPRTDDDEACWLVSRVQGGVRFRGWRGLLQRIAG